MEFFFVLGSFYVFTLVSRASFRRRRHNQIPAQMGDSYGYGVAGHKNTYSFRAVPEDEGLIPERVPFPCSVSKEAYIDPKDMKDHTTLPHSAPLPSSNEIKNKIRMGVPFDHLFWHVKDEKHVEALDKERFQTVMHESFGSTCSRKEKMRHRTSEEARSRRINEWRTTTGQM
jgi:hypothetical protein